MIETLQDVLDRSNVDPRTACWHWTGAVKSKYHTPIFYNPATRQGVPGRRVVWAIVNGGVPDGLFVVPKCRQPGCLNPSHLSLKTRGQYMKLSPRVRTRTVTTVARMILASRKRPDRKLTLDKAREIRARVSAGERPAHVAAALGVSRSTVNLVKFNRIWREVTPWGVI